MIIDQQEFTPKPEISRHGNLKAILNLQETGMFTLELKISEC